MKTVSRSTGSDKVIVAVYRVQLTWALPLTSYAFPTKSSYPFQDWLVGGVEIASHRGGGKFHAVKLWGRSIPRREEVREGPFSSARN